LHWPTRSFSKIVKHHIGTADEILVSGKLNELMEDIERLRSAAREKKGWIMDTYLLRRAAPR
jgi:precorrin-6A synthase